MLCTDFYIEYNFNYPYFLCIENDFFECIKQYSSLLSSFYNGHLVGFSKQYIPYPSHCAIMETDYEERGIAMKIIDAHLHFANFPGFNELALAAGHENTAAHLEKEYQRLGFVCGIVMGNQTISLDAHHYPPFLRYCIGLDRFTEHDTDRETLRLIEGHLQRPDCVGLKLYPGYNHFYVYDPSMDPFFDLAAKYHKPVAIHTGLTATDQALLKYSHPFTLDEAAVRHPDVQLVMCHIGNPFLESAIAVLEKNKNVAVDLSGLLEGRIGDMDAFLKENHWYIDALKGWLVYLNAWDRIMFGTDWPLPNLAEYIAFTKAIIPQRYWENVFWKNAARIYRLDV